MIEESFDLPYVARLLVRRYWSGLSEEQRQHMAAVFSSLTISNYAARFDGFSGERFVVTEERPVRRDRMLVRTQLRDTEDEAVSLDYVLRRDAEGNWRIVNVIAEGVSELALRRTEYGTNHRRAGLRRLARQAGRAARGRGSGCRAVRPASRAGAKGKGTSA